MVGFTNTVIIATSNLGAEPIQRNLELPGLERKSYDGLKAHLPHTLRRHLQPEFSRAAPAPPAPTRVATGKA